MPKRYQVSCEGRMENNRHIPCSNYVSMEYEAGVGYVPKSTHCRRCIRDIDAFERLKAIKYRIQVEEQHHSLV
jgi:hypothetical protein